MQFHKTKTLLRLDFVSGNETNALRVRLLHQCLFCVLLCFMFRALLCGRCILLHPSQVTYQPAKCCIVVKEEIMYTVHRPDLHQVLRM